MTKQKGFSLLEILVAFSIMGLSLGILLKIFSSGVQTATVAETYTRSVQTAESLMARAGVESALEPGRHSGDDNGYHWTEQVSEFSWDAEAEPSKKYALYKVVITVFKQGEENRAVELRTLKLVKLE